MRGRKPGSEVRQRIVDILYVLGKSYPYKIAKIYNKIFPKVTIRVIYYHLKKGVSLNLFKLEEIKASEGNFSWGRRVEHVYYSLGENANPSLTTEIYEEILKFNSEDYHNQSKKIIKQTSK